MQFGAFRLGLRTLKSAFAVMLCILLFHFLDRGSSMIASLSAVFALRQNLSTSVSFGKSRIVGNSLGGLLAISYIVIQNFFTQEFLVELFLLPLMVVIVIVLSDGINNNAGIIPAVATLLMITLSVPEINSIYYAFERIIDTFIGTFIAIGLNAGFQPKPQEAERALEEDLKHLEEKEKELVALREKIREKTKMNDQS